MDQSKDILPWHASTISVDPRSQFNADQPVAGASSDYNSLGEDTPDIGLATDLLVRGIGAVGIGLAAFTCYTLYHLLHRRPAVDPTIGQFVLATITFLGASIGSGLLVLGRHVYDRIEVAERWRRRW